MVDVKGDNGEVWKARVLNFNLRRKFIQGHFFVQRQDELWCPEAARPQDIHFNSILGIANGDWVDGSFSCCKSTGEQEKCMNIAFLCIWVLSDIYQIENCFTYPL